MRCRLRWRQVWIRCSLPTANIIILSPTLQTAYRSFDWETPRGPFQEPSWRRAKGRQARTAVPVPRGV
ncbi:hypothetical protein GW17_00018678 [Ensete ventricosum]|nr:hypothetical protein GW17_00018678 [Ensete ventricosum]